MLAAETTASASFTDKINNSSRISTVHTTVSMSSSDAYEGSSEADPDSIKNAVLDAARKTQDRLAAYQQRQAAKAAAAALAEKEKLNAAPTKEKLQIESNVSRLQALVSESKRLTNKSKELNAAPSAVLAVAAPTADEILASSKLDLAAVSAATSTSTTTTPRGRKLSEIMLQMHPSTSPASSTPPRTSVDSGLTLNKFANSYQNNAVETAQRLQEEQQKVLASLSVADVDEVKFEDENENRIESSGGDNDSDSQSSGELSILSLVEDSKRRKEFSVNGVQVDQEDAEEMMKDYYSSSQTSVASDLGSSVPCLDDMGDGSDDKPPKSTTKKRRKSSKKKDVAKSKPKVTPATQDDLPLLEAITETPKVYKPKLSIPDLDEEDDDEDDLLDSSMPALDPFDTPKGFKPKMAHPSPMVKEKDSSRAGKWNKKLLAINKNLESKSSNDNKDTRLADKLDHQKSPMGIEENSMNLSEVFQQSITLTDSSPKKGKPVRRPSLENVEEGSNEMDTSNDRSTTSRRSSSNRSHRKSRSSRRGGDDDASVRSSRSTRSMSRSRRSAKNKKNLPPKRKKSFKNNEDDDDGGDSIGSSKPTVIEQLKGRHQAKQGMDVSELSVDASSGMQDVSPDMRDASDLSSSSRSARRGRSSLPSNLAVDDGDTSRADTRKSHSVRRGVSRSGSTRSQSRSASVRRHRAAALPRPNKADSMEDGSMRDASLKSASFRDSTRRRVKDSNASLRGGSFKEGGIRQRRSISTRRNANRRSQRGGGDDEEPSQASTADDILNAMDLSEIEIVGGVQPDQENVMVDDSRTSIYDKKEKRPSVVAPHHKSLAGLSQLQSDDQNTEKASTEDGESIQSSATKKSRMSKFATSVGRKLTMKKGRNKKDSDPVIVAPSSNGEDETTSDTETGMKELAVDPELAALAAEYDAEEEELEGGGPSQASAIQIPHSNNESADASESGVNDNNLSKAKKGRASVMFSAIKKVGKLTKKKKKKKSSKDKNAEVLDSDSESEGEELPEGSGYSGGTLDRSTSETGEICDSQTENFAQVNFEGDKASVSMCGGDESEEAVPNTPTRARQRRSSAVNMRRQRADRQRAQSLHAVLGNSIAMAGRDDDSSVQGSVTTADTSRIRSRRAQSLRGRVQRNKGDTNKTEGESKKSVDVKRAKSLKARIETSPTKPEKMKNIRRSKSVQVASPRARKNIKENELPAFDWQAYSAEAEKAAPVKKGRDKRKSAKMKESDKRMSGGLSKLIYHQQGVAN